jgi:hypothetical protein
MTISLSNTFSVSVTAATSGSAWRANAPLNTYYSIPNTAFSSYTQAPQLPFPYLRGGPNQIIDAWGALAHSPNKKKLFAWGGGHSDYAGNDMYEFDFGADSPSWTLIKAFTPAAQIVAEARRYNDGNPVSSHTYYNLLFIDQMNELIVHALDAIYLSGNSPYGVVERFDYASKTWRPIIDCPPVTRATGPGIGKCKHPITEEIYWVDNGVGSLRKYNPVTGAESVVGTSQVVSIYGAMCVDPIRNRILRGPYQGGGGWVQISLSNGSTATVSLTGDSITNAPAGSLVWDSIGERFIHIDKNNTLTAINPTTYVATRINVAGTAPPAALTGFHSRSVFDASMKGIFTVPTATANVHFIKLYA